MSTSRNASASRASSKTSTGSLPARESKVIPLVYDELPQLAHHYFRRERPDHTLQPTALVHEAYLRLANQNVDWKNRPHFMAICAKVMRQVLVDYARGKRRLRRGGQCHRIEIDSRLSPADFSEFDILSLHEAIEKLSELDAREGQIVEMRFFGGLTVAEIAEVLSVSKRTIEGDWQHAKAWLRVALSETAG